MTYEELMGSIGTAAAERKRELGERAAAEAAAIRKSAAEQAVAVREEAMERARRRVAEERGRLMGRVREEVRLELLRRRNEVFRRAFESSGGQVLALRGTPVYRGVAKRLAEEAIGLAGGTDLVLHVDPRDRSLFEGILGDLGRNCDIAADLEGAGGLTVTSRDGRFLVTNTLEARLARARETMKGEVHRILSGG